MAARLPVVASAVSAIPEVIGSDGTTGLLVPPDDPAALAAALTSLLDDASTRQQIADNASRRLRDRFSPTRMAREHEALYDACLAEAGVIRP
jgi:glycosyltransferase involved in cell wall biosynthesis